MNKQQSLYLVRHAQSNYNLAQMVALKSNVEVQNGAECLVTKFSPELIDCTISELGRKQAAEAGEKLKNVNVTLVISSPLRRCLETTREIFKNHPNKPKVVVWPVVKEMLLSACDMSDDLATIKKEYPGYDFSVIDALPQPELWLFDQLKNETIREELLEELFKKYPTRQEVLQNAKYFIPEKLKQAYPNILEVQFDLNQRVSEAKKSLEVLLKEVPSNEAVVVVAHSRFLEAFTSESFKEEDGEPINSKWFANCEVAAYSLEKNSIVE